MFYTLHKVRSVFTRRGYKLQIWNDDGSKYLRTVDLLGLDGRKIGRTCLTDPLLFYGNDGRKVRAEAIAAAKQYGATEDRTNP